MGHKRNKGEKKQQFKEKLKLKQKETKQNMQEKRARLIVKNLPFKSTEENLKTHFEQFGEVKEVKLLKRPDGKLVGCGFIQYSAVQQAAKAKHHVNGKPFLGRDIQCDFAISKDRYVQKVKQEKRTQFLEDEKNKVKTEGGDTEVKIECDDEDKKDESITLSTEDDEEKDSDDYKDSVEDDEDSDEEEENSDEEEDDAEEDVKHSNQEEIRKPHVISNDVTELKTVFVKNLPFEATNDDLKACMSQFGPLFYALVCMDRMTEHSKGTGFVKFRNKEDADKCLQAGTELTLLGNILDCHIALGRNEMQQKNSDKEKKHTDSRNLYLVKEGVVLAGSKAAEGLSSADMAKRLQLEQYKTQMLRNLNMFVSRNRLIIHNLPPTWDDSKVRELFKKHSGPKSVIKESKIMRNMKSVDSKGVGLSKEYGFVTFTSHEHALNALRSLNNNPNIFSEGKRPIVAFSIENKVMVKAKEKRIEQSRKHNPLSKEFDPASKKQFAKKNIKVNDGNQFSGVAAQPGVQKMRSKYNLKTQAQLHHENLRTAKKKKKMQKKTIQQKKETFIRQPQQKVNKSKKNDDSFSKMVNSYKRKLIGANEQQQEKKGKWYE